jgi:hypothetical protein
MVFITLGIPTKTGEKFHRKNIDIDINQFSTKDIEK